MQMLIEGIQSISYAKIFSFGDFRFPLPQTSPSRVCWFVRTGTSKLKIISRRNLLDIVFENLRGSRRGSATMKN